MNKNNYWFLSQELLKTVEEHNGFMFESWEAGLSSTESNNLKRVKNALNALDELNSNNLKNNSSAFFQNVSMLIKDYMKACGYEVKTRGNTYTIKRAE